MSGKTNLYIMGHIWIVGSIVSDVIWKSGMMLVFGIVVMFIAMTHTAETKSEVKG